MMRLVRARTAAAMGVGWVLAIAAPALTMGQSPAEAPRYGNSTAGNTGFSRNDYSQIYNNANANMNAATPANAGGTSWAGWKKKPSQVRSTADSGVMTASAPMGASPSAGYPTMNSAAARVPNELPSPLTGSAVPPGMPQYGYGYGGNYAMTPAAGNGAPAPVGAMSQVNMIPPVAIVPGGMPAMNTFPNMETAPEMSYAPTGDPGTESNPTANVAPPQTFTPRDTYKGSILMRALAVPDLFGAMRARTRRHELEQRRAEVIREANMRDMNAISPGYIYGRR